jgi:hypothetical protein
MFGGTGSNRDVHPERSSYERHREKKTRLGADTTIAGSRLAPASVHEQVSCVPPVRFSKLLTDRNPHIGLPEPFRIVALCGETTALEGKLVSC